MEGLKDVQQQIMDKSFWASEVEVRTCKKFLESFGIQMFAISQSGGSAHVDAQLENMFFVQVLVMKPKYLLK
jgi:hypothetical protein